LLDDFLLNGLGQGAIYAFIALGYTMVYGIIRLINFAHGEVVMVGAYAGYFVLEGSPLTGVPAFLVAILAGGLASGVLAVLIERLAYRPVRRAGRIAALMTAVGVSLLLQNLALRCFGATPRPCPDALGLGAEGNKLLVFGMLVALAPVLRWLVLGTRTGRAMRAVSEDADAARLMGIPTDRVIAATFFLGAVVAGVGGVMLAATYGVVQHDLGFLPGMKAFVAAVIGGIGSIPGALVGGLVLGLLEALLPFFLRSAGWDEAFAWKDAIAFAFLILVLVVRPTGLLGRPERVKV
jgi:branched-chain amino acid transport system permease protein